MTIMAGSLVDFPSVVGSEKGDNRPMIELQKMSTYLPK
jgi:hypothetical protein